MFIHRLYKQNNTKSARLSKRATLRSTRLSRGSSLIPNEKIEPQGQCQGRSLTGPSLGVLKLQHSSEFHKGLVKTQIYRHHPQSFLFSIQVFAFLVGPLHC